MRILIHGINFPPELIGIGKYSGEMAEWFAAQGHEVRVVTAQPYYPHWRIANGFSAWRYQKDASPTPFPLQNKAGYLVVYRCPLWVPSKLSGLKRLLHLASFALSSFPVMMRQVFWHPDVVLVVVPPLFCAPQAWLVARLSGGKAWLHIQDFEVDTSFDLGILRARWLKRWVLIAERLLKHRFDGVSTISVKMLERLEGKGVASDRAVVFPNWVDLGEIRPLATAGEFRGKLGLLPNQVVALYSGNMGEKQGLEIVLEAAAKLQGNSLIRFVMCGDGAAKKRLVEQYGGLPNVLWLPLQPLDMLNELLNIADIHLLPQRGEVADLGMPSKLLGMLASGRPVLASTLADTQISGVVSRCGVVTPQGDVDAFSGALLDLAGDPVNREKLGMAGRLIAEKHFSKEAILRKFEQELEKALHL